MPLVKRYTEEAEAFWQRLVLPEDDPHRIHIHCGGYRWFRDPNIIPIEHWMRVERKGGAPQARQLDDKKSRST